MKDHEWHYAIDVEGRFEKGMIVRYRRVSLSGVGYDLSTLEERIYRIEPISRDKSARFLLEESSFNETFKEISVDYLKCAVKEIEGDDLKKMLRESKPPKYPSLYSYEERKAIDDEYDRRHPGLRSSDAFILAEKQKEQEDKPSPWKSAKNRSLIIDYREPAGESEQLIGHIAYSSHHYIVKTRGHELIAVRKDFFHKMYEKLD